MKHKHAKYLPQDKNSVFSWLETVRWNCSKFKTCCVEWYGSNVGRAMLFCKKSDLCMPVFYMKPYNIQRKDDSKRHGFQKYGSGCRLSIVKTNMLMQLYLIQQTNKSRCCPSFFSLKTSVCFTNKADAISEKLWTNKIVAQYVSDWQMFIG